MSSPYQEGNPTRDSFRTRKDQGLERYDALVSQLDDQTRDMLSTYDGDVMDGNIRLPIIDMTATGRLALKKAPGVILYFNNIDIPRDPKVEVSSLAPDEFFLMNIGSELSRRDLVNLWLAEFPNGEKAIKSCYPIGNQNRDFYPPISLDELPDEEPVFIFVISQDNVTGLEVVYLDKDWRNIFNEAGEINGAKYYKERTNTGNFRPVERGFGHINPDPVSPTVTVRVSDDTWNRLQAGVKPSFEERKPSDEELQEGLQEVEQNLQGDNKTTGEQTIFESQEGPETDWDPLHAPLSVLYAKDRAKREEAQRRKALKEREIQEKRRSNRRNW